MGFLQFHHSLFLQNQISLFQLIAKALKCKRFVAAAWLQDKQSATQCRPTTDLKKSADRLSLSYAACMCLCILVLFGLELFVRWLCWLILSHRNGRKGKSPQFADEEELTSVR
jgi:hypothetical protein